MNLKSFGREVFLWWMLIFVPISIISGLVLRNEVFTFITALLALVPIAQVMGFATRELATQTNPTISGLVSATFGNLVELIIAINALRLGLVTVVTASVVGCIMVNILLLIGMALFFGGLKYKHQHFNKEAIGVSSTMLIIVVAGLAIPSMYSVFAPNSSHLQTLSNLVVGVLALTYIAGLWFSLRTHKDLFDANDDIRATNYIPRLNVKDALLIMLGVVLLATLESNLLVGGIEKAAHSLGITETFIGLVLIAIVTNIAEISTAIDFAVKNNLDVSIQIGLSSATQAALFVAPILVVVSQVLGNTFPMVFTLFEVVAILLGVLIVNDLAADGRCNWLEGAQLISVYLIIAAAFFFI